MAVRSIDANELHAEISKWPESVMYKDWVQSAIANAPTLTPLNKWVSRARGLDELYTKLQAVTGFTAEQLLEMFLAGYTLEKPDYSNHFAEMESLAEAAPPNEWVSVEDRLPRVGGNYICAVQDKNGGKWTIPSEWNLEMKTWFGAFGEIKNKVTHWMLLPAPPDRRPPEGEEDA